jgi:hypothetical protein
MEQSIVSMKTNILIGLLISILLLNGLAILFWQQENRRDHFDRKPPKISKVLQFSGQQKVFVDKLEEAHFKKKEALLERQKKLRREVFVENNAFSSKDSLLRLIGQNQQEIEHMTSEYFNSIRAICTNEQALALNRLIEKMIQGPPQHRHKR